MIKTLLLKTTLLLDIAFLPQKYSGQSLYVVIEKKKTILVSYYMCLMQLLIMIGSLVKPGQDSKDLTEENYIEEHRMTS